MAQEATEEVKKDDDGIDLEDVLMALAIEARTNPEGFNADSLKDCLIAAGLGDIWEDAGAANEDEEGEDEEDEEEDEDGESEGDDGVTDDDEDEEVEEGEGDEDE